MINPYLALVIFIVASAGFAITMLILSSVLGPKNKTVTKQLPFECGSVSVGDVSEQRFHVRYYLVAVMFILFDIEVIFMYPWAVNFELLGWNGFYAMFGFIGVLIVGLVYIWKKGILDWNS